MDDTLHWLDVEEIAEELLEEHPEVDPLRIGFPRLRELVTGLDNFEAQADHPCNEKILETIQAHWITMKQGEAIDDD